MSAAPRVLVLMPAHNEAASIGATLARIREFLPEAAAVVIDDYSSDGTRALALEAGAHVVALPWNLGYGGAVQAGFKYALAQGYECAIQMDADGQHDPASSARAPRTSRSARASSARRITRSRGCAGSGCGCSDRS